MGAERKKVLVVEDDACTYKGLERLLEHYGCDVRHAGTVAEGLRGLDEFPEYIFLDIMLPDGEGTRILERVRMSGSSSRVIVVSAMADRAKWLKVKSLRPDAVLPKPVDFMSILELMKPAA
jgi:two-component system, response regulator RegA